MRHATIYLTAILISLGFTVTTAHATPWVTPEGVLVLRLGGGADTARYEYLPDGERQTYPLSGRFDSYYTEIEGRYGLLPKLEVGAKLQLKGVSYTSDPLLFPQGDPATLDEQGYRESVFNFTRREIGLSDIYFSAAYQHLQRGVNVSSSVVLKLPTGYTAPQETFADSEPTPDNLQDDVTLGDGKMSLEYRLHVGTFINSTLTLIQGSAGYEARFNGPGHRGVANLKVGQGVDQNLFFFVGGNFAYTLFDGKSLGQSYIAIDSDVPATEFTSDNVAIVDATLDSDYLIGELGVLARLGDREVVLSVNRTFWGRNFPELTGVSINTILIFD